jgi:hypothetical protein
LEFITIVILIVFVFQKIGRDATVEFNMLHKADVVDKYAPNSIIGKVKPSAKL